MSYLLWFVTIFLNQVIYSSQSLTYCSQKKFVKFKIMHHCSGPDHRHPVADSGVADTPKGQVVDLAVAHTEACLSSTGGTTAADVKVDELQVCHFNGVWFSSFNLILEFVGGKLPFDIPVDKANVFYHSTCSSLHLEKS